MALRSSTVVNNPVLQGNSRSKNRNFDRPSERQRSENSQQNTNPPSSRHVANPHLHTNSSTDPLSSEPPFQGSDPDPTLTDLLINMKVIRDGTIEVKTLIRAQSEDPLYSKVIAKLDRGEYHQRYIIKKKILFRKSANGNLRICLPESLMLHIFTTQHYTNYGQHRSARMITKTLSKNYYAPNMLKYFLKQAQKCYYCLVSNSNTAPAHPLQSTLNAAKPREIWSFDICGGLSDTQQGNSLIHIFVDNFSLYTLLVPTNSKSCKTILGNIKRHVIAPFTTPHAIRSDGESGLIKAAEAKQFAAAHGIKFLPTAPFSPFSNGLAEGRIKTVKELLRSNKLANPDLDWDDNLHLLQTALNQTVSQSGFSPEEIFFGFENARPNDPLFISSLPVGEAEHVENVKANLDLTFQRVTDARDKQRALNEKYGNAKKVKRHFQQGQLVYVLSRIIAGNSGLLSRKRGPYIVMTISDNQQTAELQEVYTGKYTKQHFTHILPAKEARMTSRLSENWESPMIDLHRNANSETPRFN